MGKLRIRDDTEGHNRGYQLESSNGHVQTPDQGRIMQMFYWIVN